MKKIVCGISACILAASASVAQAGGYVGLSIGQTNYDFDTSAWDDESSLSITGGYKINKNFAIEASYINLGDLIISNGFDSITLGASGLIFSAVGIIPVNDQIDVFGKVGVFMWERSVNVSWLGSASDDGTDLSIGIGTTFNVTDQFGIVIEYQRLTQDDFTDSNIAIGARLNFQ